jgi:hypothetical protein
MNIDFDTSNELFQQELSTSEKFQNFYKNIEKKLNERKFFGIVQVE